MSVNGSGQADPSTSGSNGRSETDPLDEIRDWVRYRPLVEKTIAANVVAARADGKTWEQIADALGVTHQAARSRYRKMTQAPSQSEAPAVQS